MAFASVTLANYLTSLGLSFLIISDIITVSMLKGMRAFPAKPPHTHTYP